MAKIPVLDAVRIIPREADYLDRRSGSRGDIYFDGEAGSLRLYDGQIGGITLLKDDLSNISPAALNKNVDFGTGTVTAAQFIGAGIGAVLGDTPPTAQAGTLWFNTSTGKLYIYYNDGTSLQWVQPMTPSVGGGSGSGSSYTLPTASTTVKGGVKIDGTTITLNGNSQLVANYTLPTASTTTIGGVKIDGSTLAFNGNGQLYYTGAGSGGYTLPTASTTILGGVKVDGLTITIDGSGVISSAATATAFTELTDVLTTGLTVDQFYLPAITRLSVTNSGAAAYRFDQYSTVNNPTIYAIGATTIAFDLSGASGHPFLIQDNTGTNYNTGLTHVTTSGTVTTGSNAQGKSSGTLYWKIPDSISGNYRYQCSLHAPMIGTIVVKNFATL